jgi:hypothetical protein
MRFKGKKPIASYKDTYDLPTVFDPIIAEGLRKFIEVKHGEKSGLFGVPTGALVLHGLVTEKETEDLVYCDKVWDDVLNKIHYAFSDNGPNIREYDFDFDWIESGYVEGYGQTYTMKLKEGTEAENARYDTDMKKHEAKVKEGRELFYKFYDNLWW